MYDAMEDIEVCPMSNIVDWDNYDTTGVRFVQVYTMFILMKIKHP